MTPQKFGPHLLAELFLGMDEKEQAEFFAHAGYVGEMMTSGWQQRLNEIGRRLNEMTSPEGRAMLRQLYKHST
jgi:hypothetical protein